MGGDTISKLGLLQTEIASGWDLKYPLSSSSWQFNRSISVIKFWQSTFPNLLNNNHYKSPRLNIYHKPISSNSFPIFTCLQKNAKNLEYIIIILIARKRHWLLWLNFTKDILICFSYHHHTGFFPVPPYRIRR